ncbi:hypothetical protein D3C87_1974930 [compost metagenome]
MGESRVVIDVRPRGGTTVVRLREWPVAGPGRWVPRLIVDAGLYWRNRETLRRLAFLAEGRARQPLAQREPVRRTEATALREATAT